MGNLALWLIPAAVVTGAALIALAWRPVRGIVREIHLEKARELFSLQRERLELVFIQNASRLGKPRGLQWVDCEWEKEVHFARRRDSRKLVALVGVTIRFEPAPGSDMEDWAQARDLRNATGVFLFHHGQWHTEGRALFNLDPAQALERMQEQFQRVEMV
jgi:hypothetical protein